MVSRCSAGRNGSFSRDLPVHFGPKLEDAHRLPQTPDFTDSRGIRNEGVAAYPAQTVWRSELGCVERVKSFSAELDAAPFAQLGNVPVLCQRQVEGVNPRRNQR